jgi:hypothetical protein
MASLTLADPDLLTRLTVPSLLRSFLRMRLPTPDTSPEPERALREFTHEILERNPDAFASELDIECMMHRSHGWF